MRKSLLELQRIEKYLRSELPKSEHQKMEQALRLDNRMSESVARQRFVYEFIRWSGRRRLKKELRHLHRQWPG